MRILMRSLLVLVLPGVSGAEKADPRPASLAVGQLKEYKALWDDRQALVKAALKLASGKQWLKYPFGGADPARVGFDCSGATYFLLKGLSYEPVFKKLKPEDLGFWSGT
jgi:cell wall-associated NlpC family hydrolase